MAALAVASASSGAGRVGIAVGEHARSSMRGLAAELGALHDQHAQPILVEGTRQHSPMMPPPTMTVSQDFTADIVKRGGALATCPRHTELLAAGDGSRAAGDALCCPTARAARPTGMPRMNISWSALNFFALPFGSPNPS
jgi:hypothetical protein